MKFAGDISNSRPNNLEQMYTKLLDLVDNHY